MNIEEATALAEAEIEEAKPLMKQVNNEVMEFSSADYDQAVIDLANSKMYDQTVVQGSNFKKLANERPFQQDVVNIRLGRQSLHALHRCQRNNRNG